MFYLNKAVSTDEVAILCKFTCQLHLENKKNLFPPILKTSLTSPHLVVAKERSVDNHDQRFSKSQHFKAGSSASMADHKVRTFHILKKWASLRFQWPF